MDSDAAQLPLSDRLLAWFETNKKQALWGAVIIVAAGLLIGFLSWRKNEKEIEAGQALSAVSIPYTSGVARGSAADAYLKVANNYPNTKAATRALLLAAADAFAHGNYDQARTLFERFRHEHGDSPLAGQAMLGIAASLEAQGKTAEAVTAYKDLTEHRPNDTSIPQAKFALANLYEQQNKPELAFPLFEDVFRMDPSGPVGSEAGIRAEELKEKHPDLVPPPSMPTGSTPIMIPSGTNQISIPPAATGTNVTAPLRSLPATNSGPSLPNLPPTSGKPAP